MARWLVTGGAGFIGSHLAEALVGKGETVRIADSFITGNRRNLAAAGDRAELVEGDLADPAVAARAVAGMDYVLHQAAIPSVPRSVKDPATSNRANVDAMKASGNPEVRRFLGLDMDLGRRLGLNADWTQCAIRKVGNYGELFERHLGLKSPLKLERQLNNLASHGGLHYAPAFR